MKGLRAPLAGGLLLAAATPPAWFPGAEFLVVAGLGVWHALATNGAPLWRSWLLGCVHLAWFSWSLRHVLVAAWIAIALLGGLYYALGTLAVRAAPRRLAVLAFGVATAGASWLRAHMPEICYPHGQPCHAFWQWPSLLGSVVLGGEALANGLLGAFAAALAGLARSWRLAAPPWPTALRALAVAAGAGVGCTVAGHLLAAAHRADGAGVVRVAAVEPGFHFMHEVRGLPREQATARYQQLVDERLLAPTRGLLAAVDPPDVVLWPESSLLDLLDRQLVADGDARLRLPLPRSPVRLVLGAGVREDDAPPTPAALAVDLQDGRVLAHQEKRCLVPGGEIQPFVRWLPPSWAAAIRSAFEQALGSMPEATPGALLPPLRDGAGVPFGALLCYDNAFAHPARDQVARGARWLAVLSNECWYEGGGELVQLVAMTVVRALETGTPLVRCTQDGWTVWVDGQGRVRGELPLQAADPGQARVLRADVPLGPGALPGGAAVRAGAGPTAGAAVGLLLVVGGVRRLRRRLGVDPTPGPGTGS